MVESGRCASAAATLTVSLFYGCDLPIAEIADALAVAENTVKSSLSKARSALRVEMEQRHVE